MRSGLSLCCISVLVVAASCSSAPEVTFFEDGSEFGAEIVTADRSTLPGCDGEDFCSNAVISVCLGADNQTNTLCVESPNGDRSVRVEFDVATIDSFSPSGESQLVLGADESVLISADGERIVLDHRLEGYRWMPNGQLIARSATGVEILSPTGEPVEAIPNPEGVDASRFADITDDGNRLLFLGEAVDSTRRGLDGWVYDRSEGEWSLVYSDVDNFQSEPGFNHDETSVIAQLSDDRNAEDYLEVWRFPLVSIDIDSGDVTTLEESSGASPQVFSVSPDGRLVAVRGSNVIRVVDTETGRSSNFVQVGGSTNSGPPRWSSDSQFLSVNPRFIVPVFAGDEPRLGLPVDMTPPDFLYLIDLYFSGYGF